MNGFGFHSFKPSTGMTMDVEYDHHGNPTISEADKRRLRIANARRQPGWVELERDKVSRHSGFKKQFIGDQQGALFTMISVQVFGTDVRVRLNESLVDAFYVTADDDLVFLQRSSDPATVEEFEQRAAERAALRRADRERLAAETRALRRADFALADLVGEELPGLREAALQLDAYDGIRLDAGEISIRLPLDGAVPHEERERLLRAARTVWAARELVEEHLAGKRPLASLPAGPVLADGTVQP